MSTRESGDRFMDLIAANALLVITAGSIFLPVSDIRLVWGSIGLVCALVVPGYAIVSALFPDRDDLGMQTSVIVALTVPISGALIIAVGLLLDVFYVVSPNQLASGIIIVTQLLLGVAGLRRWTLTDPKPIIDLPLASIQLKNQLLGGSAVQRSLYTIGLGALILIVIFGTTNITIPGTTDISVSTEGHTEMYLKAAVDGSLNIDKEPGSEGSVVVHNKEQRPQRYTLVIQRQHVFADQSRATVIMRNRQSETVFRLVDGESTRVGYTLPFVDEGPVRIAFLLYTGEAPATPSIDTAYRELHIWLRNETSSGTAAASIHQPRERRDQSYSSS